jgi:predicted ATPase
MLRNNTLISLQIKNFRSLRDVKLTTDSLTVLFGPNGAGKSTFLEALWLARECAVVGVDIALSRRHDGVGARWDGAKDGEPISIGIETQQFGYEIQFDYQHNRITPRAREKLLETQRLLIDREIGPHQETTTTHFPVVTDPNQLSQTQYTNIHPSVVEIEPFLRRVRYYQARSANFSQLRQPRLQSTVGTQLNETCDNLWFILHHLYQKRAVDNRYNTIMELMQESFPRYRGLVFEQTASNTISAHFLEKGRREPTPAFGIADSYLQMLVHLTALFSENKERALILLDEPEGSLHPWALSVLADAVEMATQNKQVLMATQSPVLISQFEPQYIVTTETDEIGQTVMTRASESQAILNWLDDYEMGLLYMSEMVAPQSQRLEIQAI